MISYVEFLRAYSSEISRLNLSPDQKWDAYQMYQEDPHQFDASMMSTLLDNPVYNFKEGDLVHYYDGKSVPQKGIVKTISGQRIWVVFRCAGEWDKYRDYTGENTPIEHLFPGWPGETEV